MMEPDFDVDIVYLWVDGSDSEWRRKRNALEGVEREDASLDCEGRYADNDELKYSLRALERNAPWIRRIFIVTDGQRPAWLDIHNPKIRIVDHSEILPEKARPTFNSVVIEHNLHRIPGLAEHFLYSNDDMFINRPVKKSDFFTADGLPMIRFNRRVMRKLSLWGEIHLLGKSLSNYNRTIMKASELVKEKFGKYIGHKPHHNVDAFRKSDYANTFETFREAIEPTLVNHFRSDSDIQRVIYSYAPVAEGKAVVKYVNQTTSCRLQNYRHDHYRDIEKKNPTFFCVNDSQYSTDDDRRMAREWLDRRYPEPSGFEKGVE